MELRDYLRALRAHWVGALLIVVLAVAAAAGYSATKSKVYAANASGIVSAGQSDNAAIAQTADALAKSRAASYVDIAKSRATATDVINDLGLSTTPQALIRRISVQQPIDTVLLQVNAKAATPKAAQQLADAWVRAIATEVGKLEDPSGRLRDGTLRVTPVDSAALPTKPVSPNVPRNLALGLIVGLVLGLGYSVLRRTLDRRLHTVADVESRFPVHVAGAIPTAAELEHKTGERMTIVVEDALSGGMHNDSSEAFRKLRTNLRYMDVDNPLRVIVVTSPKPSDGKSTVSGNLAAALAISGEPTVLVDADLRRPTLATAFGVVEGVGLTDVLTGMAHVQDVLQPVAQHPKLKVLASGSVPPNPSELLGSQAMRTLLTDLAGGHTVIVDAPPLLPVTDAAILTAVADGALVVISAGRTLDTDLDASLGHLEAVDGRALGVVFNRVPRGSSEAGYYRSDYYRPRHSEAGTDDPAVPQQQRASIFEESTVSENGAGDMVESSGGPRGRHGRRRR